MSLLVGCLYAAEAEEPPRLDGRSELYLNDEGHGCFTTVMDYGGNRWYLSQDVLLFPPRETKSPFTELNPPRRLPAKARDLLNYKRTAVGFSSAYLWFGPLRLTGSLALAERPLEAGPFSGAWNRAGGTRLSVVRTPPRRAGVGGAVGPVTLSHFREEGYRRTVAVIAPVVEERNVEGGEFIASRTVVTGPLSPVGDEPWFLKKAPRISEEGCQFGYRHSGEGRRLEQRLLALVSTTPRDLHGFAVLSAGRLTNRPWGVSLAAVGGQYRDGELRPLDNGFSGKVRRRPSVRSGHALGGTAALETRREPAAGGKRTTSGGIELLWRWRPDGGSRREPRWGAGIQIDREKEEGVGTSDTAVIEGTPELRYVLPVQGAAYRIAFPLAVTGSSEEEAGYNTGRTAISGIDSWIGAVGVDLGAYVSFLTAAAGWVWTLPESLHTVRLKIELRGNHWKIGLRVATAAPGALPRHGDSSWRELLEGVGYLRFRF